MGVYTNRVCCLHSEHVFLNDHRVENEIVYVRVIVIGTFPVNLSVSWQVVAVRDLEFMSSY